MNVYDQAHGLAQAIKMSEEYKQYEGAKAKINENEDLSKMIRDFRPSSLNSRRSRWQASSPLKKIFLHYSSSTEYF